MFPAKLMRVFVGGSMKGSRPLGSKIGSNHLRNQCQQQQNCFLASWVTPTLESQVPETLAKTYVKSGFTVTQLKEEEHPLSEHIQSCLDDDGSQKREDTMFSVFFLGSGGFSPSKERNCNATILRVRGQTMIFDAGEGLQRQMIFTRINLKSITKIFITHMHGDHLFGLPGLILALNNVSIMKRSMNKDCHTINIYGPPGLFNYIAMALTLSMTASTAEKIVIHELAGGSADADFDEHNQPRRSSSNPGGDANAQQATRRPRDARYGTYKELFRHNLWRKNIQRNPDGTWTIPFEEGDEVSVSAAEVKHAYGVQTFGFTVQEPEPEANIDVEKAKACGVNPGRKYRLLKQGEAVQSDDGSRMVNPEEVWTDESKHKARKFSIVGDNCLLSPAMSQLCQNSDVFVHEAALVETEDLTAATIEQRGHSTPRMAGQVAREVNAKVLVLNHISQKVYEDDLPGMLSLAEEGNGGTSHVIIAHDFMEIVVPFRGFEQKSSKDESTQ